MRMQSINGNLVSMTTSIFSYKPRCVRVMDAVSVCSWVQVSDDFDCLITGHKTGSIGFTWYPTSTSTETPYSITLSYDSIKSITHIAAAPANTQVAIADSHGSLLLLRINGPRAGIVKLATLMNGAVECIVGLAWSHSGGSLATLRYSQSGQSLSLRGYLGLNAPGATLSTVNVILPRAVTAGDLARDTWHKQQRLAWGRDDMELIVSLTNNKLVRVSTQNWQVTSQVSFPFSPRISATNEGDIFALHQDGHMCVIGPEGQTTYLTSLRAQTYSWVPNRSVLITVVQNTNTRSIVLYRRDGVEMNSCEIDTKHQVIDICWREERDSCCVVCATEEGLYSLIIYSVVPSLRDLAIWAIVDTSELPSRVRNEVLLRQSILFYPLQLMDIFELEVSCFEELNGVRGRRVLKVGKDYLGQEIQLFSLKQPKLLKRKAMKLSSHHNNPDMIGMLCKLLPTEIVCPPGDTVITPHKNSSSYSIQRGNGSFQLSFTKDNRISMEMGGGDMVSGEFREEDKAKRVILIEGEDTIQIQGYLYYFQIIMSNKSHLPLYDTLLLALAFIIHVFLNN